MGEAIAWLIPLLIIAGTAWMTVRESDRKKARTPREYEREVTETRNSLLRAGMLELDKFVESQSEKRAAVEYMRDEEEGLTKTGGKDDDVHRTADRK